MKEVIIKVEFDYSTSFADKNGKYCTYDGSYLGSYVDKILMNFDSMAYITCPVGTIEVFLQPVIDAEDFKCYELECSDSHDFMTLIEDGINTFKNPYGERVDFPQEAVEYLYDKTIYCGEIVWILKEEIRNEIERLIDKTLEGYIEECGYKEIDDMDDWDW